MIRTWLSDHRPPLRDIVLAVVFVLVGQVVTWGQLDNPDAHDGGRAINAVLNLLLTAALAWRRRAPLGAVSWAVAVYFVPRAVVSLDIPLLAAFVPLIVLTASAGYHCTRRRATVAVGVAYVGFLATSLGTPWLRDLDALVFNSVFLLTPWLAARGLRDRENRAAALASTLATERAAREVALHGVIVAERARIARELHDIVAHNISIMLIQSGAARMQLPPAATGAEQALLDAEAAGRQALDDLRRVLGVLRADEPAPGSVEPSKAPQPRLADLETMVSTTRALGMRVEVQLTGDRVDLAPALELTTYRIVQEALTNTIKHSGATEVLVHIACAPTAVDIDVIDNGNGAPAHDPGHGLVGIQERVALFGGVATAGPAEDGGWRVHATLPRTDPRGRLSSSLQAMK